MLFLLIVSSIVLRPPPVKSRYIAAIRIAPTRIATKVFFCFFLIFLPHANNPISQSQNLLKTEGCGGTTSCKQTPFSSWNPVGQVIVSFTQTPLSSWYPESQTRASFTQAPFSSWNPVWQVIASL